MLYSNLYLLLPAKTGKIEYKMRKKSILLGLFVLVSNLTFAGGILTNTNQNIAFNRTFARNATMEIDGAYSNPAGLSWLSEGLHLSLNIQNVYQTRDIHSTYSLFKQNTTDPADENGMKYFKGEAAVPALPSLQAAYRTGNWTYSLNFGITGGGGKATFNDGLPSFESTVAYANYAANSLAGQMSKMGLSVPETSGYSLNTFMKGRQYVFGLQGGVTYRVTGQEEGSRKGLSLYLGARMNYVSNRYEGYLRDIDVSYADGTTSSLSDYMSTVSATATAASAYVTDEATKTKLLTAAKTLDAGAAKLKDGIELDCSQNGWGLTAIIGVDYRLDRLNLGVRYEFPTNLNIENDTRINTTGVTDYDHGVNTPNDLPAILSGGAQYDLLPKWRVMGGVTYYFDKDAGMANDKQKYLSHNTFEYMLGTEWDVYDCLTVSGGFMKTNYGTTDQFQKDMSFYCSSYSLGFGAKINLNQKLAVNIAYFFTNYTDYERNTDNYNSTGISGKDVFGRTNKVFGLGINYDF